jgi:hypothetical protein
LRFSTMLILPVSSRPEPSRRANVRGF